tara:strand:- start:931 stop:1509 length:579 start_codon:yes stop_codon:yes gene_type:complete
MKKFFIPMLILLSSTNLSSSRCATNNFCIDEKIIYDNNLEIKVKKYFEDYSKKCQIYLDRRCFKGTPLTGEILSECAKKTYIKKGILIPLELVLSQAQMESHMGTKGKSCVNNPFNVGEYDHRTALKYYKIEEGVQAYFNLIASDYLSTKEIDELLQNFTNSEDKRYASSKSYERKIKKQFKFIKKYIKKRC